MATESQIEKAKEVVAYYTLAASATGVVPVPPKTDHITECVFPGTDKAAPLWVCDAPVEGMAVGAVGSAV